MSCSPQQHVIQLWPRLGPVDVEVSTDSPSVVACQDSQQRAKLRALRLHGTDGTTASSATSADARRVYQVGEADETVELYTSCLLAKGQLGLEAAVVWALACACLLDGANAFPAIRARPT